MLEASIGSNACAWRTGGLAKSTNIGMVEELSIDYSHSWQTTETI